MRAIVAGIDGTRAGWVCVTFDGEETQAFGAQDFKAALSILAEADFIAIDMPIGFRDEAIPGGRVCEMLARRALPGRASSVFSSPCRLALAHDHHPTASSINRDSVVGGVGLSKQSHAIFPKMRQVDEVMTPTLQNRVFEVHPEVSFAELAKQCKMPITASKKKPTGSAERLALLDTTPIAVGEILEIRKTLGAARDDVLDAAIAAWTAHRRLLNEAYCLPPSPPTDAKGLRMEVWV